MNQNLIWIQQFGSTFYLGFSPKSFVKVWGTEQLESFEIGQLLGGN